MISKAPEDETVTGRGAPSPPQRASARTLRAYTEEEYKDHRVSAYEPRKTRAAFHLACCRSGRDIQSGCRDNRSL